MRPTRLERAVLAVVAFVGMVLVGVVPAGVGGAQQVGQRRVVIVGDSVAAGAEHQMVAAFRERGWAVTFDAAISRPTRSATGVLEFHRAELTDTVVLSLGANDSGNTAAFRASVDRVMSALQSVPRVFWLSIAEARPYYVDANHVLRDAAARFTNLTVLDWHATAAVSPAFTASDGLHLSPSGAAAMVALVGDAVWGAPPPAAPTTTTTAPPPTTQPQPPPTAPSTAPATSSPATARPATTLRVAAPTGSGSSASATGSAGSWWRSALGWTIGGFVLMVAALAVAGTGLGAWSLWATRHASTRH